MLSKLGFFLNFPYLTTSMGFNIDKITLLHDGHDY